MWKTLELSRTIRRSDRDGTRRTGLTLTVLSIQGGLTKSADALYDGIVWACVEFANGGLMAAWETFFSVGGVRSILDGE